MMSVAGERLKDHRSEIDGISMGRVRLGLLLAISWWQMLLINVWLALVASSFSDLQYWKVSWVMMVRMVSRKPDSMAMESLVVMSVSFSCKSSWCEPMISSKISSKVQLMYAIVSL